MARNIFRLLRRGGVDLFKPNRFGTGRLARKDLSYYLDFSAEGMERVYEMTRDKAGIVMMRHHLDHESNEQHYYSPVKIAHYVLGCLNDIKRGGTWSDRLKAEAIQHGNFLIDFASSEGNRGLFWRTPTSNPRYALQSGYISAIAQGVSISALIRLYRLTNNDRYKVAAIAATKLLTIPIEEGGLLARTRWGNIYEEYPCSPPSHVVNGFMFAIFAMRDLADLDDGNSFRVNYDSAIETLRNLMPVWLLGRWSTYDLRYVYNRRYLNLATRHYQFLHADQLTALAWLEGAPDLLATARKMELQASSMLMALRAYCNKCARR